MTVQQLEKQLDKYRASLSGKTGKMVMFSESGPANIELIDSIVTTLKAFDDRIKEIEHQVFNRPRT